MRLSFLARHPPGIHLRTASRKSATKPKEPPPPPRSPGPRPPGAVRTLFNSLISPIYWVAGFFFVYHISAHYFYEYSSTYGVSMMPTLSAFGDRVLISKWYRRGRGVEVGDLVSFSHPVDPLAVAVKRVVGMPGDIVLRDTPGAGKGMHVQVPQGHCWVVGDNLPHSRDSRMFGPLPLALIQGKVIRKFDPWYRPHPVENGLVSAEADDDMDSTP